eukprot:4983604-Amphidinium_carterae.1
MHVLRSYPAARDSKVWTVWKDMMERCLCAKSARHSAFVANLPVLTCIEFVIKRAFVVEFARDSTRKTTFALLPVYNRYGGEKAP